MCGVTSPCWRRKAARRGEGRAVVLVEEREGAPRLGASRANVQRRSTPDAFFEKRLAEIERTIHAAPNSEREG